ncbi:hypothetical protein NZX34_004616 [Vibrio parahaemolyticus]|uniref:hypothetical protein n=4 Tax=Vibrio parahaemolyticus TaxID=670 RepID=UPI0014809565|nr:hypothetical protein [Vibrio parahaemolyticus]EGQ7828521.1 hypothetical protein [Vibrio parahaemolyticus]EJQ9764935.1 hypothetical protein [Vibrio parahaemolyticus]
MEKTNMYDQPQKIEARKKALTHAVEILTSGREEASVVPKNYIRKVKSHLEKSEIISDKKAADICNEETCQLWESFWEGKNGSKSPNDLVVAYLAGPNPLNDFNVLVELGVHPHNIYAFESDKKTFNDALLSVKASKYPLLKIIKTSLEKYLQAVPVVFDIIYFDACGPLPSNSQTTLRTILNIFRYQRLSPLGVLITNFSLPDISKQEQLNSYSDLVSNYLYSKRSLESGSIDWNLDDGAIAKGFEPKGSEESESFFHHVKTDFRNYYGQYITRQIFDISSFIAPMGRFANSEMWKSLFKESAVDIAKHASSLKYFDSEGNGGDYICDTTMFSLGWTATAMEKREIADLNYPNLDETSAKLVKTWFRELGGLPSPSINMQTSLDAYNVIRIDESYCMDEFSELLSGYKYMQNMYMFCDVPSAELALYSVIAQFSYPSHFNVEQTKRFSYIADGKQTEMFLDVVVFDTCRYIYDWLPSTELVEESFSNEGHQLAYRFALDGLAKHTIRYCNEYFYGANIVGWNHSGFTEKLLTPREKIS